MSIDPTTARLAASGVAYAPQIAGAARKYGVDPDLLAAVAAQETGGPGANAGRNVVGDGGHGRGLFQIDDRWHPFASTAAAMDPGRNADYAAGMISGLLKRYGGNVREALSAYNSGSPTAAGTRTRWADGSEPGYADSVLRHYGLLAGTRAPAPAAPAAGDDEEPQALRSELAAQAQRLPMPLPSLPSSLSHAHQYHHQLTDYTQLFDDESDS